MLYALHDKHPKSVFESRNRSCNLSNKGKVVLHGRRETDGAFYQLELKPIRSNKLLGINSTDSKAEVQQLFYERFGHQNYIHLTALFERKIPIKYGICETCIYGRVHRFPFGEREKCKTLEELFATDACGTFQESFV